MKRKLISLILVCTTAGALLSGCAAPAAAPAASSEDEAVAPQENTAAAAALETDHDAGAMEIPEEYWYPWGGDSEVWDAWRMDQFNKSQDKWYIRGQYVPESSGVNNGKLLAAIQSGDVPDVIIADNTNAAYTLVAQGAFEPLDDAMNASGFDWDRLNPSLEELM